MGGGISGLSAAYYLKQAGARATVVEQSAALGGVIRTEHVRGCTLEGGPDSFLSAKPAALDLIRELGLSDQVIGSKDEGRLTFILKNGELVPLPEGMMMMVPTRTRPVLESKLLGGGTKLRMALDYFRPRWAHGSGDRSVAEFLRSHYGQEAIDYLAEPLLAGVYGGDPEQLSAAAVLPRFVEMEAKYGSLTRAALKSRRRGGPDGSSIFKTLRGGLGSLIDALAPSADVVQGRAETLERDGRRWRVRVNGAYLAADCVIVAARAWQAAELLREPAPELAGALGEIQYNSSVTLSFGYKREAFRHELRGFGFLVPKVEGKRLKACTFTANKFDHRVPPEYVVLRCFLSDASAGLTEQEIVAVAREELREILGIIEEPLFYSMHRWPRAMAQYTVGHQARVERIETLVRATKGLYLAGNAYHGIGIPDCIASGKRAAHDAAAGLHT